MPLFLSSTEFGNATGRLRAPTPGARALVSVNALDQFGAGRASDLPRIFGTLMSLGWQAEELDLRDYFGRPDDLAQLIDSAGLLWVEGGNTFVLARSMTMAGLAPIVWARLQDPTFIYGGCSAGAVAAGPDLDGIDLVDDPRASAPAVPAVAPAKTLSLVPFRVVPHWRSNHDESSAIEHVATYMREHGLDHICLRDGEALWLDDQGVIKCGLEPDQLIARP